jgi:hypothetical protein
MAYPILRGVRAEVQATTSATKSVTAVTQADPGVATSTSHGMANGTVGYFTGVTGMVQLEGQAIRVANTATNSFDLEKLKTTAFPAFTGTATFTPIATWNTIGHATGYQIGGGDANDIDQTTIIDDIEQLVPGILSAQTVTISGFSNMQSSAMLAINQAAIDQTALVFRVTLKDNQQRVFRGIPSLSGEGGDVGQSLTGSFTVRVSGRVMFLPPTA